MMPVLQSKDFKVQYQAELGGVLNDTLLIHGEWASALFWEPARTAFRDSVQHHMEDGYLITYDWLGAGGSDKGGAETLTLSDQVEAVKALLASLGLGEVNIVTHSAGLLVALALAQEAPSIVRRLIAVEPCVLDGKSWPANLEATYSQVAGESDFASSLLQQRVHQPAAQENWIRNQAEELKSRRQRSLMREAQWLRSATGIMNPEQWPMPALIVHGEWGMIWSKDGSRELAKRAAQGAFREMKGVGSSGPVEDPQGFVDLSKAFLFSAEEDNS